MRLSSTTQRLLVKSPRVFAITILLILFTVSSFPVFLDDLTPKEKVKIEYLKRLSSLEKELKVLETAIEKGKNHRELQLQFRKCRLEYKKIAYAIDYFNPYQARLLNGPALQRTEEDNPQTIIEPQGFQVLEEYLFNNKDGKFRQSALQQTRNIAKTVRWLINEPDLQYKFNDDVIFQALRAAIIRLASMGISGFDSPIAQNSLPESEAVITAINTCLSFYKSTLVKKDSALAGRYSRTAAAAQRMLRSQSFAGFDRLTFIKEYANPLFKYITAIRDTLGVESHTGLMPVNPSAGTLTDPAFFNTDFFSPNERYRITKERVELGKLLFNDAMLSGTKNRSCASCHKANLAFTDGVSTPLALDEKTFLPRNTPTLWNSVFQTRQFFDSRTTTLENQLSDVVHNSKEMQGSLQEMIPALKTHPTYASLFSAAYKNETETITQYNIANAIASYIRTLVATDTRFDRYLRGEGSRLTNEEKSGFNLFMGKAKCGTCHYFPLFNGLVPPDFNETESEVLGVPQTRDTIRPVLDPDLGKYNFTKSEVHRHAFKTPTLRNIELTAPYMHNGVFQTLEEVMIFYNKGGGAGLHIAPPNQTLPPDKLGLTQKEINNIITFMKALTDEAVKGK